MEKFAIAIHGGAGTILKKNMSHELELQYRHTLEESLKSGYEILSKDGPSVDAVEAAIKVLEASTLFNAGRGSVFNCDGENEMDAAMMDGRTLQAGAVAGLKTIVHPITAAKLVMNESGHLLMIGDGAERYLKMLGIQTAEADYFFDQKRWDQLQRIKGSTNRQLDHVSMPYKEHENEDNKYGTVGAVAIDKAGNLCAGSSTGGLTNKMPGRVGDSPIIGAGTYANNKTCAVAATGEGEYFMRSVLAYDISAMMEYKGLNIEQATYVAIKEKLSGMGGKGGIISIDKNANISIVFNTKGMYRGYVEADGKCITSIYE